MTADERPRLVLASANPGKVAELDDLLGHRYSVEARPADLADTIEDGDTLDANAIKKAVEVARHTGRQALADDTGLFVTALGGRPGVHTARYAGEHADDEANVAKLLGELAALAVASTASGRPGPGPGPGLGRGPLDPSGLAGRVDRTAEFRTVIALASPEAGLDGDGVLLARGSVVGRIAEGPRGDRGFGYDPVFAPVEGDGRTFAEMSLDEKHGFSHRARALRALLDLLS